MELIPAAGRQWKTWSTWIATIATGLGIAYAVLPDVQDLFEPKTFAIIMTVLAALIKVANLIKQNIPVTEDQRDALVSAALSAPIKQTEGEKQ